MPQPASNYLTDGVPAPVAKPSGVATPTRSDNRAADIKRKQTLLSLLDVLNELKIIDDNAPEPSPRPTREVEHEGPSIDEQLQVSGAEVFNKFQRRINSLDAELRSFSNATRQLGSSVGLVSSAFRLRERLAQILYLFRENASELFPRKVTRPPKESYIVSDKVKHKNRLRRRKDSSSHAIRPAILDDLDPEDFPEQFEKFAADVTSFLKSLNEFPEFGDEAADTAIRSFEADLRYWASCLKTYEGQFKFPAVRRYLHDLSAEMGEHLEPITTSLQMFLEIGIPTIRFAQKHAATNLLNLTTVATFFSAVTATTLQFSYASVDLHSEQAVNGFWFCSLVFSIASAVNSLLGLTWKQAIYRSPGHRVPWWVLIWIKRSPLIFLVVSVAAFEIGLCLFAYTSHQHPITSALTTVFTALSSFGLIAVSAWFMFERWTFNRHKGKKWLMDVLAEIHHEIVNLTLFKIFVKIPAERTSRATKWSIKQAKRASTSTSKAFDRIKPTTFMSEKDSEGSQDVVTPGEPSSTFQTPLASPMSDISKIDPTAPSAPASSVTLLENGQNPAVSDTRRKFASAVRSVMMMRSVSTAPSPFVMATPRRQRTASSSNDSHGTHVAVTRRDTELPMRTARLETLVPALKCLQPTQDIPAHQALVRHLQFSPDGKYLATCSWDRTCVIFNVGEPFTPHRVLAHPQGFVGQVAWAPSGKYLLTKMVRGIKVWTSENGVCRKTIDRKKAVQSIAWYPGGEAFVSVEDSEVVKLDVNGKILDTYTFERLKLHDVAVTSDGCRLLCVATLLSSCDHLQPSKSRAEKQIIVYNTEKKEIENQVPVLHEVRDITLARGGNAALVSYENKAPPQLWRIEFVKDRTNEANVTARLSLHQTYMPKMPVDFAGPSYFGGSNDQLVLCAGKAGDIHIWDRETSLLLHYFRAEDLDGDLTCMAWNHSATPFMFATGSHDGAVRIWTTPPKDPTTPDDATIRLGYPFEHMLRTESPTNTDDEESEEEDEIVTQPVDNGNNNDNDNNGETLIADRYNISGTTGRSRLRRIMFAATESGR